MWKVIHKPSTIGLQYLQQHQQQQQAILAQPEVYVTSTGGMQAISENQIAVQVIDPNSVDLARTAHGGAGHVAYQILDPDQTGSSGSEQVAYQILDPEGGGGGDDHIELRIDEGQLAGGEGGQVSYQIIDEAGNIEHLSSEMAAQVLAAQASAQQGEPSVSYQVLQQPATL